MTFKRRIRTFGNKTISKFAKNPYYIKNNKYKKTLPLWAKVSIPSLASIVGIVALIIVIASSNNQRSFVFQKSMSFSNYSEMIDFYNSKYNIDEREFVFVDTSSIDGQRLYTVSGIDSCISYDVDCLKNNDILFHYVYGSEYYEYCRLPFSYSSIREERNVDLNDFCCEYYLSFLPRIENVNPNLLVWERWYENENEVVFHTHEPSHSPSYERIYYTLKHNNNAISRFEFTGVPELYTDEYDENTHSVVYTKINDILGTIIELFRIEYGD